MSDPVRMLKVLETHKIKCHLGMDREGIKGGFIVGSEYVWFINGSDIALYSKSTGCVESSRSFGGDAQTDNSIEITFVQELHKSKETMNMLLVGCSCKSYGILFVCQLPTLKIIRCIHIPSPISYISTINNESLAQDQLCDEFKVMSTILLVGMITGAVYAVDLRKRLIENQIRNNEIVVNESSPSKLFIIRKNNDCREAKKLCDQCDFHLAMFINEKFCNLYKKQCRGGKLNFNISCLLYTEEINAVAIGYNTGHFQLWDCKVMHTLYVLKNPECHMPITHISFLEQADDPNNLCYLWIIQSDNSRLPNAIMITLSYEHRIMMSNGCCSYRVCKEYNITFKMQLRREFGIGRCVSALTLCNSTLVRKSNGVSQNCGVTLFAMLMEIRQNEDTSPNSYVFVFDVNQWNKAQMPSIINHFKVSNSYASFVKLPDYASYLDFNISNKTLRPFGSNFGNNVKNLFSPSSIYFECECLLDTKVIRFKHVGVQQEILDQLILNSWSLLINPSLIFSQCLQTNLTPFFWDKTDDYKNYTLFDKLNFVVSIILENNIMSVFDKCAIKWKNGTHSEVIILHLVECLWNHVMLVKQYADKLCVPLFDCSGALVGKKHVRMLNECLSQMLSVENIFKRMQFTDCVQIINIDLVNRVKIVNLVTQYFNAMLYFVNLQMLPKQIEVDPTRQIIRCDFSSLIQYASKRRMEFGNLPLYLIDAIITNEPNGNKLIQQWKHECIGETKGFYPPSSVQCLLRIYLNAELSNRVKDFITIYFLIDVCSVQKMNEITANIFNDTFVKNEELYKLCCASWLFDHDMFEDAMLILASNNEWMVNDKSWNWYHWTVLKLFVFKKQYYWAQIYLELFDIKLVNLDDHKFYVNLQIMNNNCFDALCHLNLRKIEEKIILFEYIFDRCRHTNQLKTFLSYPLDPDEKKLFFSCLKKFEDTKFIQFMFLVQEKRYFEALELSKSLKVETKSKDDYILTIASVLVGKIKDNISSSIKTDLNKNVFSNEEIKMTFMNCFMDNHINMKKPNTWRSYGESCPINLIVPNDDIVDRIQGLGGKVSTVNGVLSTSKIETVEQIENKLLKLLDTPFIQNISTLPSITNCLAVPKKKSAIENKLLSTIKLDKTPETLTFDLPDNNSNVKKFSHKEGMSMKNIRNSNTNNLPINMITEQSLITFHKLLKDNSKIKLLETAPIPYTVDKKEYEKMDISDNDQSVIPDGEYKYNFEKLDVLLDSAIDKNNSEVLNVLHDDVQNVQNHLDQLNVIVDIENEDDLKASDVILNGENYEYVEKPDIILDSNNTNNSEQPDNLLGDDVSVEHYSHQQSVVLDGENEDNLEEPVVIIEGENKENSEKANASEQNIIKLFETIKNEKTPKNNVMVDHDNLICTTESKSNILENVTPYIYGLTEENHSNNDNQIIIIEKKNENENDLIGNKVDGNQTSVIIIGDIAEEVENTNNDNKPSTHQPTSLLLNEPFLNDTSLGTTADVIETRDSVVDKNIEIFIDKISENVEPSSSNTTINTNLFNKEIKSYQLVEFKDISSQLVDPNILNSVKRDFAVELQNSCFSAASEPSKTVVIEKCPTNNMLYKDISIQKETSKLVDFINSNSDIENGKHLAENVNKLSKDKKNKQPINEIEKKKKYIPNPRKKKYGTKCIPCSDTKLTIKSRSESKSKRVELKIISSNIFSPTSDIFEDCLVSTSRKRPKCQKKIALIKRRRICPEYVASKDKASNREIDLEQISEENKANKDKNVKNIEELLPNNLLNENTESLEEVTKLAMPIKIKSEAENNNKIHDQNVITCSKNFKHKFFLEPKLILEKFDVSLYKNRFKPLAMENSSSDVSLSTNKINSQKPIALKRFRKGCLRSMKDPTATNTIINLGELNKDSISKNKNKNKAVTKKIKLNSSNKIKKVEIDKNLKPSSNQYVTTSSIPNPNNCLNKIHNSLIEETINLISDDEFVSNKIQEEMDKISSDKEKLDWMIISHDIKTNMDTVPKIRIGRNKSELNTNVGVDSQLDLNDVKRSSTIVLEQEMGLIKKSSKSKILNFNQQVCRRSSRKILKKPKCSCCTNKLMDDVCSSNVS